MTRILCIGDIHGGLRALIQCLERCSYNPKNDKLIFLGDYSDGWPETAQLIEYLINMKLENPKIIFIKGNHDEWTKDWLIDGKSTHMWKQQGGNATIDSYIETGFMVKNTHKDFYKSLINYYIDDENRGFVHGGFKSKEGLGHEVYYSDYYWDRDMWELAVALDNLVPKKSHPDYDQYYRPNPYRMYKHEEVFIGHSTTTFHKIKPHLKEYQQEAQPKNGSIIVPMNRCNVWNMDTGGGFEGKLSIMDINTKKYWQSDFVKNLYSKSKGRQNS